jgi:hypothetical protein
MASLSRYSEHSINRLHQKVDIYGFYVFGDRNGDVLPYHYYRRDRTGFGESIVCRSCVEDLIFYAALTRYSRDFTIHL